MHEIDPNVKDAINQEGFEGNEEGGGRGNNR